MAADLAAALAARQTEEKVRRAVLARYEVTGNPRDRVRCDEVAQVVADELNTALNLVARQLTWRIVVMAGGMVVRPLGRRFYAKIREREAELLPQEQGSNRGGKDAALARMRRAWWARLAKEGLDLEDERGRLKEVPHFREYARDINVAHFEKLTSYYWLRRQELDVLGLYALEGLSVREIAAKMGLGRDFVHRILRRHRKELAEVLGHLAEEQERGADDDG